MPAPHFFLESQIQDCDNSGVLVYFPLIQIVWKKWALEELSAAQRPFQTRE